MSEIGSEFWNAPLTNEYNKVFPKQTQWYLSGRSALQAIINELRGAVSISLPSWCCDSMIKPFADAGFEIRFYPVYRTEGAIQEAKVNQDPRMAQKSRLLQEPDTSCDVLFLMDYFGYTSQAPDLSGYEGIVIRDVTHSIFSASYSDADYYFGSLRKWCGVYTGGYAWCKEDRKLPEGSSDGGAYVVLRERAMLEKAEYIEGKRTDRGFLKDFEGTKTGKGFRTDFEGTRTDKGFLKLFSKAEELLDGAGIAPAADRDIEIARTLDVDGIRKRRRANAEILRSEFPDWLIFPDMKDSDCPMFVPVIVPNGKRTELRQYLIEHEIYCPVHWPVSSYHKPDEKTRLIYENELSLVCDQRYTENDMDCMVQTIKAFWKEKG